MKILNGLSNHSVLQRNKNNVSEIFISGYCNEKKSIFVTWDDSSEILPDSSISYTEAVDSDYKYYFTTKLIGIPVGGPYHISLEMGHDSVSFSDVLVGDVFVLAGQSNMEGIGRMSAALDPSKYTRALYMDDSWGIAKDPLHQLEKAVDPVHRIINGGDFPPRNPEIGVGPGVSFSQTLHQLQEVPIGLICCAHGGTSMEQWKPTSDFNSGDTLYGAMMRRIKKAGSNFKGLFWHQGCNDAYPEAAANYSLHMTQFIEQFRKDVKQKHLPIVMAQISKVGSHGLESESWNEIQNRQFDLEKNISNLTVLPTIHFEMDDFIHLSGNSQNIFGKQAAHAMHTLIQTNNSKSIQITEIKVFPFDDNWNCKIEILFNNVIGSLESSGLPNGFTISTEKNTLSGNYIYKTELVENKVILYTTECALDIHNMYLSYGLGFQPYCNITDQMQRSLPVFMNVPLGKQRVLSEPCTKALIMQGDKFKYIDFGYYNLDLKGFFTNDSAENVKLLLPFSVQKELNLNILLGGLGKIQVLLDNTLLGNLTLDSKPVFPDSYSLPCQVSSGTHILEIQYSKSTEFNKAICVRLENLSTKDIPLWTL